MKAAKHVFLLLFISLLLAGSGCASQAGSTDPIVAETTDIITLTQAERDFIAEHPSINLGVDPEFIPYEFIDSDGKYKGIAADYVELIAKKTGLQMVVTSGLTWSEAYEKAVEGELDVLSCVSKTAAREEYFLFSDPYYDFERAVYTSKDNKDIKTFDDLAGKTVAVQTNSSHHSFLLDYSSITLSLYPTVEKALQAVSDGKETAFVGNFASSNYMIKSIGITNLTYFKMDTGDPQSLHFAVRKDWPELVSIINKALASISEEEKIAINNKWIGVDSSTDYTVLIRALEIAGVILCIIFVVSIFWIFRLQKEIRKRKRTQEELKAAKEEAERANQIKSIFLARMSHEIRTPLNAITGMSYLIKKTGVTTTQGIYLDKLTHAARNMLGIINDILDFSKIEAGKIEIERISFDLDKVLHRVISIASVKVEEQGIKFTMEKDPIMPEIYLGDPTRIEQILINLLNNAIKFTEKGSVSLSVRVLSQEDAVYHIEFSVRDTGIGMLPDQVNRIFVPFDQADSTINRRFGGTGLGLSIVKNLTDLMGGEIEVESEIDKGSVFRVCLPMEADTEARQSAERKMAADCFRSIHALVLDQNGAHRVMLQNCLLSFGISADYAGSETEAEQILRNAMDQAGQPHNLIIVDYATPKSGGIEYIGRIKKLMKIPPKSMLIIPMGREDLYDEIETTGIDFGITRPIIPSVIYNGIIEMFGFMPPESFKLQKSREELKSPYPYHLLLVEDNKTNQFIAQTILEQAGFRVSKSRNGEEGYHFFKENRDNLDLILMDIHMPVMDGYTATDLIRQIDTSIPIIAMTADAIAGVEENCRVHGLNHYVSKPFEPEHFIQTILDVLQLHGRPLRAELLDAEAKIIEAQSESDAKSVAPSDAGPEPVPDIEAASAADMLPPVLDKEAGLTLIGGDLEIYKMILQEYVSENVTVPVDLTAKIDAADYAAAVQIVHKVKGSSGNIGAKSLYEAASGLQKALQNKEKDAIAEGHRQFQNLLSRLFVEIEIILKK